MKTAGPQSAITAMYEYEKEYKETYGNSLSVIGSAVKRKLLNKKLIQIMDKIKYEKEIYLIILFYAILFAYFSLNLCFLKLQLKHQKGSYKNGYLYPALQKILANL